jgi:DNA repair protein RadC
VVWGATPCARGEPDYDELGERASVAGPIRNPSVLYWVLAPVAEREKQEVAWCASMNVHGYLLKVEAINRGAYDHVEVPLPVLLRSALSPAATAFALCHNHPSGSAEPSESDETLWHEARDAARDVGLVMVDHLVIGCREFYSFQEGRLWRLRK